MASEETLLDALVRLTGCAFLSDLHLAGNRGRVVQALRALRPEAYPPEEWRDAACYLCGSPAELPVREGPAPQDGRD
ncbi:hypothetical protein [uncultured Oscillibacter sp.]|uniref:hypothetical protein n=1 Tax=uncultured Oscillibacter sp. TaxID=876091 RepID=UPI0025E9BCB2|nr:hypothetical protein [uncultured Oscillibacter sp.]